MNLREGAVGVQESVSVVALAIFADGIFAAHSRSMYENGNSSYFSALISAGLSLLAFLLIVHAMKKSGKEHLPDLLEYAFGPLGKFAFGMLIVLLLTLAAGSPIGRFLLMFSRFVYVEEPTWKVMFYIVAGVLILAWMGFETIARTAKLQIWLILISVIVTLCVCIPGYESYRLYPLLGDGMGHMLMQGVKNTYRYFAPLCAWLCLTKSAHGLVYTKKSGVLAMTGAGVVNGVVQLCLGLTYPYQELAAMHSPMYRITMVKEGTFFHRMDKLLLFFWLLAAILGAALHVYAASLLFAKLFRQKDIRPAAASIGITATALALMGHLNIAWFERLGEFLANYGWMFLILPLTVCALLALLKDKIHERKRIKDAETI